MKLHRPPSWHVKAIVEGKRVSGAYNGDRSSFPLLPAPTTDPMHRFLTALTLFSSLSISTTGCVTTASVSSGPVARIAAIEAVHGGAVYNAAAAVEADLAIEFGPMVLKGDMTFTPSLGRVKLQLDDTATVLYDNETSWIWPAEASVPGPPARFHVVTWPYFVAAPFKLDDPGTTATDAGVLAVTGPDDRRAGTKVSFDAGVGDAPDDWYIAFTDDQGRMDALGYIVTFGKTQAEAEEQPSIILYSDFVNVDGVELATTWTFHLWDPANGVVGEPKGRGKLDNIEFVEVKEATFAKPVGAIEVRAPGK